MAMYHTDDQAMLRDTARPFIADAAPVKHLRQLRDSHDKTGFSRDLWKQFAEMGFTGILVPEAHGGLVSAMSKRASFSKKLAGI
jgi:alkylation response protein AidB-like acyl-CoA dehydrogenase